MEILVYTLEDKERNEQEFSTQDYSEARERAMKDNLRVICNEFEWSDSYMVDDFTGDEDG